MKKSSALDCRLAPGHRRKMLLTAAVPGKPYYAICLEDVPEWFVLGGKCFLCDHQGAVDRWAVRRRWGDGFVRFAIDPRLRCTRCGNRHHNTTVVFGKLPR